MPRDDRPRIALVGSGARAEMRVPAVVRHARLEAFADVDRSRIRAHNRRPGAAGHEPVPAYPAEDPAVMVARERADEPLVTSIDATHAGHIVTALDAGCDVITETPMTADAASCRKILDAQQRSGKRVPAASNHRSRPAHEVQVPPPIRAGHGGADQRMTAVLLGGETDPPARSATARDGALVPRTGLAANQSLPSAEPVRVAGLLDLS